MEEIASSSQALAKLGEDLQKWCLNFRYKKSIGKRQDLGKTQDMKKKTAPAKFTGLAGALVFLW